MPNRRQFLTTTASLASLPALYAASSYVPLWAQNAAGFGTPTLPTPGFRKHKVGDVEVIALIDGIARRPLGEEFVKNAPLAEVKALLSSQNLSTDYVDIPFTPFVVVVGGRRVLLDTGMGEFGGPTTGKLLAHLAAAGLSPADIDVVLLSHFHGDHINGIRNKAGELVFPKATVMVPAPEYGFWMDDARMNASPEGMRGAFNNVRRTFGGMTSDRLVQFVPGTEPVPGIRSVAAFGHTPGHTLFEVASRGQTFLYVADLTNVPALFARNPDWAVSFDMDAEAARKTRREVFARIVNCNATVGGFHFPFPAMGCMKPAGNGYAFEAVA
jgi:glyoxylase-like metal-dependent hydrolase (beta-lactamase superfamily II)